MYSDQWLNTTQTSTRDNNLSFLIGMLTKESVSVWAADQSLEPVERPSYKNMYRSHAASIGAPDQPARSSGGDTMGFAEEGIKYGREGKRAGSTLSERRWLPEIRYMAAAA